MSSTPIGRKPGRPVDPMLAIYRNLFPEWSPRTIARYHRSMARLDLMGLDLDAQRAVLRRACRANGSINVLKLETMTEGMAAMWLVENCVEVPA